MPSSKENEEILNILFGLSKKIESSHVLNGGFEKLLLSIDHIKEKQEETCDKVDRISTTLYEPDSGFFSRVKVIETSAKTMNESIANHIALDEKKHGELEILLKNNETAITDIKPTITALKKISGENLENVSSVINTKKTNTKFIWVVINALVVIILGFLWNFVTKK